jgi:lipid-binding SYLF domain-containing protein
MPYQKRRKAMVRTAFQKMRETAPRQALPCFLIATILLMILPVFAADKQKDEDTLRQANLVLQGFLDSNSISPTLLAKANCVLILPGVKKFGFGVGGSGGRGPLLCRGGQDFKGKWSTPAMLVWVCR